jgi:hypothetical protein
MAVMITGKGGKMSVVVPPNHLQPGDVIQLGQEAVVVKYVEHDLLNSYDVGIVDKNGNSHIAIVSEPVIIIR